MAFDITALFAGALEGAAGEIETRNKQIRTGAVRQLDQLVTEAEAKEKGVRTEKDVMKQQITQLRSVRGMGDVGLTDDQILGLIQVPENAKSFLKAVENQKDLRDIDLSTVLKIPKPGTKMPPEEYLARKTTIVPSDATKPTPVVRGAFGFESPAQRQAEAEFEVASGKKVADLRTTAKGRIDLGQDFKQMETVLNLAQFANPDTIANVQGKLRDAQARGEDLDSPQNKLLAKKLAANAVIENQFKGDGEDGKPRTAAAINSIVDKSLRVGLGSYELKGMIRFDPKTNEPVVIAGDAKAIEEYNNVKRSVVENQFKELNLIRGGKIVKDRNARDAILPYASIDKDDNVIWRKADSVIPEAPPPAGPKAGAPSSVTAPAASQDLETPGKVIITADGKGIDVPAMAKAYPAGKKIADRNGNIKIWNGMSLQ